MTIFIILALITLLVYQFFTLLNLREKLQKAEGLIARWQEGIRDGTIVEKSPRGKNANSESDYTTTNPATQVNWEDGIIEDEDEKPKKKGGNTSGLRDALGLSDFEPITQQHIAEMQGRKIDSNLLQPDLEHSPSNSPFYNKKVVLTGDLSMDRKEAAELLFKLGADINTAVSKKTHYLIVGQNPGWSKMDKAQTLIQEGAELQILYEADLWALIDDFNNKAPH